MSAPTDAQIAHQELIDKLDIHSVHKSFRNPHWRPNQRRNKNIKTILGDASRKEASSIVATPQDPAGSGTATPTTGGGDKDDGLSTSGTSTPAAVPAANDNNDNNNNNNNNMQPNLAQASRSLSKLVLEKSLRQNGSGGGGGAVVSAPTATYTNIESAPSLAHTKRYCDVTGLPAPYLDPKSRLRYHNREVFQFIRSLPQGAAEQYLEARGAHTVLK
ncbi:hypothetical protein DL764_005410 [Monosporascus ibericus]|uniref:Vps72/YL1 C-terminal domain-containing protein n=1 Tax=Monosporascus ibericus TaxID=155417 RepID=A0A4Q4T919_9PEZI|nr:hypothetical protein DL764_005410 [Monosporascus ibericus]